MKLSLPVFMVICLLGYGYCSSIGENSVPETKSKVICEDSELTSKVENGIEKIKIVKLQRCLVSRKKQIQKEEEEKRHRSARSVVEQPDTTTSFSDLFKSSAAFKRILKQYVQLKEDTLKKTSQIEKEIKSTLSDLVDKYDSTIKEVERKSSSSSSSQNILKCEKPKQVIKIKTAVLTSENTGKVCPSELRLNLEDMEESCNEKEETTRILSELCNGQEECEVRISNDLVGLCDCTEKKHVEVEYTCEPESETTTSSSSSSHKRSKRALYYQNSPSELDNDRLYREYMMDMFGYGPDYDYTDCLYGDYNYGFVYDYDCLDYLDYIAPPPPPPHRRHGFHGLSLKKEDDEKAAASSGSEESKKLALSYDSSKGAQAKPLVIRSEAVPLQSRAIGRGGGIGPHIHRRGGKGVGASRVGVPPYGRGLQQDRPGRPGRLTRPAGAMGGRLGRGGAGNPGRGNLNRRQYEQLEEEIVAP